MKINYENVDKVTARLSFRNEVYNNKISYAKLDGLAFNVGGTNIFLSWLDMEANCIYNEEGKMIGVNFELTNFDNFFFDKVNMSKEERVKILEKINFDLITLIKKYPLDNVDYEVIYSNKDELKEYIYYDMDLESLTIGDYKFSDVEIDVFNYYQKKLEEKGLR